MILCIRTDKPDAQVGLYSPDGTKIVHYAWHADRALAQDLLKVITDQLAKAGTDINALTGVAVFAGPGSFTGLRIGITVANTIAYAQRLPIVGEQGDDWLQKAITALRAGRDDRIVLPHYGSEPNISKPKK